MSGPDKAAGTKQSPSSTVSSRVRVPRWLALAFGALGSAFGIATNLYSAEFRSALEASVRELNFSAIPVVSSAVVASGSTGLLFLWFLRRKQRTAVAKGEIHIHADALALVASEHDLIVGRSLHYLEVKRDSGELIVFLHGLGLDAYDFRPYIVESKFHCIALTLFGFNTHEKDENYYAPISLQSHVQLLAYALENLKSMHAKKRITLVGFSFGADMILFLRRFAGDVFSRLGVHEVILLDPNVNSTTTTISSKIARVTGPDPRAELVKVLESAPNMSDFRYLCEYMYKITSKNFAQIQRHAREVVEIWTSASHDRFLDYLGQVIKAVGGVHVVLSINHEAVFNAVARNASARGLDTSSMECSRRDHFELIEASYLKDRLEGIV